MIYLFIVMIISLALGFILGGTSISLMWANKEIRRLYRKLRKENNYANQQK